MKELVTSKDIENAGFQWAMIDNFAYKLTENEPLIINTDISNTKPME